MAFFKDKSDMFTKRAERFGREVERYAKKGNDEKAEWAKGQVKENQEKAQKYKGEEGW